MLCANCHSSTNLLNYHSVQNGVRSTENTCGYSGSIVLSSSDLDYVAVLFVVLGVAFLPTLIIVLEKLRTKKILL